MIDLIVLNCVNCTNISRYGRPLRPAQMGYPSLIALLQAIPDCVKFQGKHRAKRVCLLGADSSEGSSSFEESFRGSSRPRNGEYSFNKDPRNTTASRCYSAEQYRPYNSHFKADPGRWSESPKRHRAPQLPLYSHQPIASPPFPARTQTEPTVFTFDRPAPLSPPVSFIVSNNNK